MTRSIARTGRASERPEVGARHARRRPAAAPTGLPDPYLMSSDRVPWLGTPTSPADDQHPETTGLTRLTSFAPTQERREAKRRVVKALLVLSMLAVPALAVALYFIA